MSFKILQKTEQSPVYLKATLAEGYDPKDPMPAMNYSWNLNKPGVKTDYPDQLFLICEDKEWGPLEFDYYPGFGGFVVSEELMAFLDAHGAPDLYQSVPLQSLDLAGKSNTSKQYHFLRFISPVILVDYEQSDFVLKRGARKQRAMLSGYGVVGFERLVLRRLEETRAFLKAQDSVFMHDIVVTDDLGDKFEEQKFVGFSISTLEDYAESFRLRHDRNYVDPKKVERLRRRRGL